MRAKFLFAWLVILGLVGAGFFGIANIGGSSAVANPDVSLNLIDDPAKPLALSLIGADKTVTVTAADLVGVNLRNSEGELVGSVRGLADDTYTGKTYAVVVYSAPPIRREKDLIVPLSKIQAIQESKEYRLEIGRYQLENATAFEQGDFTNTHSAYWAKGNRKYVLHAPVTGSISGDGLFDRFVRGLRTIWASVTG